MSALVIMLANKMTGGSSAIYRRHFGLGTTEWRIMALLAIEQWATAQRLCQVIGFDKAAVSRAVRNMTARGLLDTRPTETSSRSLELSLSKAGMAMHDEVVKVALVRERRLMSSLTDAEQATLVELLRRLHAALPKMNAPLEVGSR